MLDDINICLPLVGAYTPVLITLSGPYTYTILYYLIRVRYC